MEKESRFSLSLSLLLEENGCVNQMILLKSENIICHSWFLVLVDILNVLQLSQKVLILGWSKGVKFGPILVDLVLHGSIDNLVYAI